MPLVLKKGDVFTSGHPSIGLGFLIKAVEKLRSDSWKGDRSHSGIIISDDPPMTMESLWRVTSKNFFET